MSDVRGAAPDLRVHHVSVVVRSFGVAAALAAIVALMTSEGHWSSGVAILAGLVILLMTIETRHPLSLRNFFLVYTVTLFTLGASLLDLSTLSTTADMVLFLVVFLAGYAVSAVRLRADAPSGDPEESPAGGASPERVRGIEELLILFICMYLLLLAWRISRYGVGAFYSGQALLDLHQSYGQASVSGGIEQIIRFFLRFTSMATVVLYVHTSLRNGIKIHYRFPVVLLVVLPILSLSRSDALIGASILLVIYGVERRVVARSRSAGQADPVPSPAGPARPAHRRAVVVGVATFVALAAGLVIGGIRQNRLAPQEGASSFERSAPLLKSELTPIQAYAEIKEHEAVLGRTHGSTIVAPLLLKLVPRALFPSKPLNSGAYYMSIVRPNEFAANFALPPTLFGDAYLNFGTPGAIVACLLLGFLVARLDPAYRDARVAKLPWFLIVFANFYGVLRDPLSESLAGLLLTSAMWLLLRPLAAGRSDAASGPSRSARAVEQSDDHRRGLGTI